MQLSAVALSLLKRERDKLQSQCDKWKVSSNELERQTAPIAFQVILTLTYDIEQIEKVGIY
jgi:hypothetical protein